MARDSFIFYASFYDALKEVPDELRLKIYDAICIFAITGEEPELNGIEKAFFTLVKPQLEANNVKYDNGCKGAEFGRLGGRPKKPQENPTQTPKKPQENPTQTPNENENENENVYPPPISPPYRVERGAKKEFFEKYPVFKGKKLKDDGIDYSVLLTEFELSATLRGIYSFSKIVAMYDGIKNGTYRDKSTTNPQVDAANARAERERYYAQKQAKAEAVASKYREIAKSSERFTQIERALANLNLVMARAELQEPNRLPFLKEEQESYKKEQLEILRNLGLQEWQLLPQYECKKCSDSGFLSDGRACDCYKQGGYAR